MTALPPFVPTLIPTPANISSGSGVLEEQITLLFTFYVQEYLLLIGLGTIPFKCLQIYSSLLIFNELGSSKQDRFIFGSISISHGGF